MTKIDYSHSLNSHSANSPSVILPFFLQASNEANSLLDVGCGTGVWIQAAKNFGLPTCQGIDGIRLLPPELKCDPDLVIQKNLGEGLDLGKKFDVAICLEVAEHLPEDSARMLIYSITTHSDNIFFSAAIPGQRGQGHINCQWPEYWQSIFNDYGFACYDDIRLKIWNLEVEPWYKQNTFRSVRSESAGTEPRILPLVHPEMVQYISFSRPAIPVAYRVFDKIRRKLFQTN